MFGWVFIIVQLSKSSGNSVNGRNQGRRNAKLVYVLQGKCQAFCIYSNVERNVGIRLEHTVWPTTSTRGSISFFNPKSRWTHYGLQNIPPHERSTIFSKESIFHLRWCFIQLAYMY